MRVIIPVILIIGCAVSAALANIILVPDEQPSVQAGIDAAATGDTVLVSQGLYFENVEFNGKAITVASYFLLDGDPAHIEATILDASASSQIDSISAVAFHSGEGSNSILTGFTIQGGEGTLISREDDWGNVYLLWAGGGVFIRGASPTVSHNRFLDNHSHAGGGLYLEHSRAVVHDCTFNGNSGGGGAIQAWESDARILDNRIEGNSSGLGGGVSIVGCLDTGTLLRGNTITGNNSSDHGAGIVLSTWLYAQNGFPARIEENHIEANVADMGGGGIYCQDCAPFIYRNLILDNVGLGWTGGGIRCVRATAEIINNTLDGNASYGGGGGGAISFYDGIHGPVPVIANNIISNSLGMRAVKCNPNVNKIGYNDFWNNENEDVDCELIYPNLFEDPVFIDPAGDDFRLHAASPCIDAGIAQWIVDGEIWVDLPADEYEGEAPDMGAFEWLDPTVVADGAAQSADVRLHDVFPNPFNPRATIRLELRAAESVRLEIYDLAGRRVRSLIEGVHHAAGTHDIIWNGEDDAGRVLPSGVYFSRLATGSHKDTKKITLLK